MDKPDRIRLRQGLSPMIRRSRVLGGRRGDGEGTERGRRGVGSVLAVRRVAWSGGFNIFYASSRCDTMWRSVDESAIDNLSVDDILFGVR